MITQTDDAIEGVTIDYKMLYQVQQTAGTTAKKVKTFLQQAGQFFSQYKGRGMDFAEVRPYQVGDDIRSIDWRVTARTGKAHTKLYHEERERPIWIAVDQSPSLFFGTQYCFKSVQACRIAAELAWQANTLGDHIGSLVFSHTSEHVHLPCAGKKGIQGLFKCLVEYNQSLLNTEACSQQHLMQQSLMTLLHRCEPDAHVVLISDFYQLNDAIEQQLQQLAQRTHLLVYLIYDPIEAKLPTVANTHTTPQKYFITDSISSAQLNDSAQNQSFCLDLSNSQLSHDLTLPFHQRLEQVKRCVQNAGGFFSSCQTSESV